jgi:DNA-binding MarR family transcriptional regulator
VVFVPDPDGSVRTGGCEGERSRVEFTVEAEAAQARSEVTRLLRAIGSDLSRLDQVMAERLSLHRTDLRCLEILACEGPLAAGRLAELAGISSSAMTSAMDRMEMAGYVARAGAAADRRVVVVSVTARGRADGRTAFADLMTAMDCLLARYAEPDIQVIGRFLAELLELLGEEASRLAIHSRRRKGSA